MPGAQRPVAKGRRRTAIRGEAVGRGGIRSHAGVTQSLPGPDHGRRDDVRHPRTDLGDVGDPLPGQERRVTGDEFRSRCRQQPLHVHRDVVQHLRPVDREAGHPVAGEVDDRTTQVVTAARVLEQAPLLRGDDVQAVSQQPSALRAPDDLSLG
ncbi:hypothetical protein GCM10009634_52880 [Saccharothrix xinjiangensis]